MNTLTTAEQFVCAVAAASWRGVGHLDWSLIVSIVALYVAVVEVRRNNVPSGRVQKTRFTTTSSIHENNADFFAHFEIVIRNSGIKLINPVVKLEFVGDDGCGGTSIELAERRELRSADVAFERSMLAAFEWRSYKFPAHGALPLFLGLSEAKKQRAAIRVYSQSYLAYEFRVGNVLDRLKHRWNMTALRIHYRFERKIVANDGSTRLYVPNWLPSFVTLEWPLMQFVEHLRLHGLSTPLGR